MTRLLVLCAALMVLPGWSCKDRTQVQDLSDAIAGAKAYQQEPDPKVREQIARGVIAFLASLEQNPLLPAPTHTPAEIRADPATYAEAGEAAQADPKPYVAPPAPDSGSGSLDMMRQRGESFLDWGLWLGGPALALMFILFLFNKFGWTWGGWIIRWLAGPILRPIINLVALWAPATAVIGAAMRWLADWWWAVALIAVAVGGVDREVVGGHGLGGTGRGVCFQDSHPRNLLWRKFLTV